MSLARLGASGLRGGGISGSKTLRLGGWGLCSVISDESEDGGSGRWGGAELEPVPLRIGTWGRNIGACCGAEGRLAVGGGGPAGLRGCGAFRGGRLKVGGGGGGGGGGVATPAWLGAGRRGAGAGAGAGLGGIGRSGCC